DQRLWHTPKSQTRLAHVEESGLSWVQLAGAEPALLAAAARETVRLGADVIDINMGCPAKKVCNKVAGSALLRDEALVGRILEAVVGAVDVPVTLKIRLGWSRDEINAVTIAKLAEHAGISLLTVHGRTRACRFHGEVDYEAIAEVNAAVDIPIIANGDITTPEQAEHVLKITGADGVMIGRAAQGRPWLSAQVDSYLVSGNYSPDPEAHEIVAMLNRHLVALHGLYGEYQGVRIARKHVGWTLDWLGLGEIRRQFNQCQYATEQFALLQSIVQGQEAA
ncbi:MAG: tRNA dihydrouridine synthase DusB, partial [Pseudomonadales bacterium]|nr:tRNA dihydrouridine synthase DusB [Pseudomonadales bacterium]